MAGHADGAVVPDGLARIDVGCISLTHMDAVTIRFHGQIGVVVHDQRHVPVPADRQKPFGGLADDIVVDVFQAQLNRTDRPRHALYLTYNAARAIEKWMYENRACLVDDVPADVLATCWLDSDEERAARRKALEELR